MPLSWQLCCLPAAKQSFENQVRSQTEFGNEEVEGLAERKTGCAFSFGVQGYDGINRAGAAGGEPARDERDGQ